MNTEQRLNNLENRVARLENIYKCFGTSHKSTSAGQGPTMEDMAKFINGQTELPLDDSQDKTGPPTWLRTSDSIESDATNIASTTLDNNLNRD